MKKYKGLELNISNLCVNENVWIYIKGDMCFKELLFFFFIIELFKFYGEV